MHEYISFKFLFLILNYATLTVFLKNGNNDKRMIKETQVSKKI